MISQPQYYRRALMNLIALAPLSFRFIMFRGNIYGNVLSSPNFYISVKLPRKKLSILYSFLIQVMI